MKISNILYLFVLNSQPNIEYKSVTVDGDKLFVHDKLILLRKGKMHYLNMTKYGTAISRIQTSLKHLLIGYDKKYIDTDGESIEKYIA